MDISKEGTDAEINVDYHKRIKSFREIKNYTQEYMAEVLHLSQRAYSSIENGQTQLTVERLFEIAKVLQVPINDIIGVDTQNIYNNSFNNNALHNKGMNFYQNSFDEQKILYERLLQAKDDEIKELKDRLNEKR